MRKPLAFLIITVALLPQIVFGAISFGNKTTGSGSATLSHNSNGDFLVCYVSNTSSASLTATYGGTSMTVIGSQLLHTAYSRYQTAFRLESPAAGSNNFVVSGGTAGDLYTQCLSIDGVDQTTPISGVTTSSGTGAAPTAGVTTTVDNAYVLALGMVQSTPTAGTNTTQIQTTNIDFNIWRSTSGISPAGAFTINITSSGGEFDLHAFAVNPASSGATTTTSTSTIMHFETFAATFFSMAFAMFIYFVVQVIKFVAM